MAEMKKAGSSFFDLRIAPWGLITTAGAVLAAASVLGFFGSFAWFLDLCSHFRVQYFLGLGIFALLLLIPRQRKAAAFLGALAVVNLGTILPLYLGKPALPADANPVIRAMLVNVNTAFGSAQRVTEAVRRYDPDILVLEEVSDAWLPDLRPALTAFGSSHVETREDNFGIALFSKYPFTKHETAYIGNTGVPSIVAEFETPQGTCTVLATHPLPPGGSAYSRSRNAQLAAIPNHVKRAASPVLLLGDLNVTPWSPYFRRLLRESGLEDSSQGRGVQPTWPSFLPLFLIPIDHCLYSPGIAIVRKEVGPALGSDHYPVIVDFLLPGKAEQDATTKRE